MMSHEKGDGFYELTFAQREGKVPLPEPMKLEHVPRKFKQLIWLAIEQAINSHSNERGSVWKREYKRWNKNSMEKILFDYRHNVQGLLADDARHEYWDGKGDAGADKNWVNNLLNEAEYHDTLSFVEFIIRHESCPGTLCDDIKSAFERVPMAYYIQDVNALPTVIPRFSDESGEALQQAIESIEEAKMEGAATHLRDAAKHINNQQYSDSIADSVHAVESVARLISPKKANTLRPALDSLENAWVIKHKVLKNAFSKLYDYTSDEQGIRHALLDKNSPEVGLDEAMFMFGACASFAAYLVNKHRQMEQQESK